MNKNDQKVLNSRSDTIENQPVNLKVIEQR